MLTALGGCCFESVKTFSAPVFERTALDSKVEVLFTRGFFLGVTKSFIW